jgi:hypothetical protein
MIRLTMLFFIATLYINGNSQTAFNCNSISAILAAASSNNTTASVIEVSKSGTLIQTISIPGTGTNAIRVSGSATSTLYAANSNDGRFFYFTGHNNTNTSSNANTLNPRAVVAVKHDGTFFNATTYTGGSGDQTRCATSLNNTNYYIADQGGQFTNGGSASPAGNYRAIKTFGGLVYVGRQSGTAGTNQVSTTSAITGGTITSLPGISNSASFQDFYLISSNGTTYDILYILRSTAAAVGTIEKYSLVSGSWTSNGTYSTSSGGFGLMAEKDSATTGAYIYFTTGTGATTANSIRKLFDAAGYNSTLNITSASNIYTTAAGTIIKGIAFSPQACNCVKVMPASVNNMTEKCLDTPTGYIYFGNNYGKFFAINKNSNALTATVDVTVTSGTVDSSKSSNGANQEHASYLMKRYWNVDCSGCNPTTNGGVSVRFFYDPTDTLAARTAMRSGFNALKASNTNTLADTTKAMQWIKNNSGIYSPAFFVGNKANGAHTKLTPIYGSQNGVNYVQFDTVKSFSGGGGGFGYGPSSGSSVGLPVTWASFSAEATDGGNKILWRTASEQNTSHFELEYSTDGIRFDRIQGNIAAAGNSASLLSYSYLHSFYSAIVYYRVKQVDIDGQYSYSKTVVVKNSHIKNENFVSLTPNFIQSNEPVLVKGLEKDASHILVSIYNFHGQRVIFQKLSTADGYYNQEFLLDYLAPGLYYIQLSDPNLKTIFQGKIRK